MFSPNVSIQGWGAGGMGKGCGKDPLLRAGRPSGDRHQREGSAFASKGATAKCLFNRPDLATSSDLEEHCKNCFFCVDPTVRH